MENGEINTGKLIKLVPDGEDFINIIKDAIGKTGKDADMVLIIKGKNDKCFLVTNRLDNTDRTISMLEYGKFLLLQDIYNNSDIFIR